MIIYDNIIRGEVTYVLNKALSNVRRVISVLLQCLAEYTAFQHADIRTCNTTTLNKVTNVS